MQELLLRVKGRLTFSRPVICPFIFLALVATRVGAQSMGTVAGTVSGDDIRLPGAQVYLVTSSVGSVTDEHGEFQFQAAAGSYTIEARFVGYEPSRRQIVVEEGRIVRLDFVLERTTLRMDDIVVTATGEGQLRSEVAASIGSIDRGVIDRTRPGHPSELMSRIPGVWVSNTSGEGHMTSIRQPLTTEPVYLYLEDGVPTRSTGFFNHNSLYEINIPQAESVEILRGPGTALYGSDAIGGVINVTTRPTPDGKTLGVSGEAGPYGFGRVLASAGTGFSNGGIAANLNVTRSDGWRESTNYNRQSGTLRWDQRIRGDQTLKTVLSVSNVDQKPAGSSALSEADYLADASQNYSPISYRKVQAVRLSTEYQRATSGAILTVTPYLRYNTMDLLPNWSLSFDPATWATSNYSVGLIAKQRVDFETMRARLIGGIDLDLSPGQRTETKVDAVRENGRYVSYTTAEKLYDYDVTFRQAAPFVHGEASPLPALRLTGGLRFDALNYDYENHLSVEMEGSHRRAASTSRSFTHVSPKLGLTYRFSTAVNAFAAYNHAFRVPSESQLFRQGSTSNTLDLKPVRVNSYEVGFRAQPAPFLNAEVSLYLMDKQDDIVTSTDPRGIRISTNAGATRHRGIEVGANVKPVRQLRLAAAVTLAKHTYEEWMPSPNEDLSGKEMEVAPREMANVILTYEPDFLTGASVSVEWTQLGKYWMDPENTARYDGHHVFGVRANAPLSAGISVYARIINLTDKLYAERATYNAFRGDEFAPGLPRAFYLGVRFDLGDKDV